MKRARPRSPNMQNYRPQLTSILSIGHRLSGLVLSLAAFVLAGWLAAGAAGPHTFAMAQSLLLSAPGLVALFLITLVFSYHLCNGIRHLVWDSVHGFELRAIYIGGWAVLFGCLVLTLLLWIWVLT